MPFTKSHFTDAGFTLPELLISLSLVGMLTVMLYGGLRLGIKAWDSIEVYATQTENLRLARNFIHRALRQAVAAHGKVEDQEVLLFTGNAEQLEFAAPLSGFLGLGGLYLLRLVAVKVDGRNNLIIERWLIHPDIFEGKVDGVPEWEPLKPPGSVKLPYDAEFGIYGTSILLPVVEKYAFSYFGPTKDNPEAKWQEDWIERQELPILVKISLGAESGWEDLIVALAGDKVAINQNLNMIR